MSKCQELLFLPNIGSAKSLGITYLLIISFVYTIGELF